MSDRWSDDESFEDLYRSTYPNVVAYCRRRLSGDQADEAVADIYAIAWRKRSHFLTAEAPLAWLYGVGFRVVSSQYRANKRKRLLTERLKREPPHKNPGTEASVTTDDDLARALAALDQLSIRDQELIRLAAFEELTYREIAAVTGRSVASVRTALSRARERLRTKALRGDAK